MSASQARATRAARAALVAALLLAPLARADGPATADGAELIYGHKDGMALTLTAYRPKTPNGAAILFAVSGGWVSRWTTADALRPLLRGYLDLGYTVLAVRHGSSPRYAIPDAIADLRRAVRYTRAHASRLDIDPGRLALLGISSGGHLSLMVGLTGDDGDPDATDAVARHSCRVAAVVALVPPTDLRGLTHGDPGCPAVLKKIPALDLSKEQAADCSPVLHATADDAPTLIVSAGKDELVPATHGPLLARRLKAAGVDHRLIFLKDAGHGLAGPGHQAKALKGVRDWLARHLLRR